MRNHQSLSRLPKISETTTEGKRRTVAPDAVMPLEIELYQRFQRTDAPDELFAVRSGPDGELIEVLIFGEEGELRVYPDDSRFGTFIARWLGRN